MISFTLLFFGVTQVFVSGVNVKTPVDFLDTALGDSLTLNCTYNCSSGFVRGCWSKASDNADCPWTISKSSLCTMSLRLTNVSTDDLKNYTCYTQDTEDPRLPQRIERVVSLQLQAQASVPRWTTAPKTETKNASLPAKPNDSVKGEFTGIKVVATVTVVVATALAALAIYLCLNRNRQSWNNKGKPVVTRSGSPLPHTVSSPVKGSQPTQSDRVTLRIPTPDNESDSEVPYADIMITVRGVSTPELTQVGHLIPGDLQEWWGDEPGRSHLQASRSADRLHVPPPREVSRKMSTNSEYAVITYA